MDTLTEQKKKDLVEIAHVAASPFIFLWRIIQTILAVACFIAVTVGTWFYEQGYNSNHKFVDEIRGYQTANLFEDAFGNREVHHPYENPKAAPNIIIDADGFPSDMFMDEDGKLREPVVFPPTIDLYQGFEGGMSNRTGLAKDKDAAVPNGCESGHDYNIQQRYSIFEWGQRNADALRRKSARMQAAYHNGIIMSSAMRRVFAYMKQNPGVPIPEDSLMFQPGSTENVCIGHPWHPGMTEQQFNKTRDAVVAIKGVMTTTVRVSFYDRKVVGMCTWFCDPSDQLPYLSEFYDIFDEMPPLSPQQLNTVQMLDAQSTDERWLQVAHRPGHPRRCPGTQVRRACTQVPRPDHIPERQAVLRRDEVKRPRAFFAYTKGKYESQALL